MSDPTTDILAQVDAEVEAADPGRDARRIEAWKMRLQGWSAYEIAAKQGVSYATSYADIKWCQENLSSSIEGGKDLLRLSLERLEIQYRQLSAARSNGEEWAHRLSIQIKDLQAKLLGLYTARIELRQVNYTVAGVELDNLK